MNKQTSVFSGFDNFSQFEIITAFSRFLGSLDNGCLEAAMVLTFLLFQWFGFLKSGSYKKYDGWMLNSYRYISKRTSVSFGSVRGVVSFLSERGLILVQPDKGRRGVLFRLDIPLIEQAFISGYNDILDYEGQRRLDCMNFRTINDFQFDEVELAKHIRIESAYLLVSLFSHYYKKYTGEDYEWDTIKFKTLNKRWDGKEERGCYKDGAELGLSRGIKKALDDELKAGKHYEQLVSIYFSPGNGKTQIQKLQDKTHGIVFDDMFSHFQEVFHEVQE